MSDRESLQQIKKEAEDRKLAEKAEADRRLADEQRTKQDRKALGRTKTAELKAYCDEVFAGFPVLDGIPISVAELESSTFHNVTSDGIGYVVLTIPFEAHMDTWPTTVPLLLCRHNGDQYEFFVGSSEKYSYPDGFTQFKELLLKTIGEMTLPQIRNYAAQVKEHIRFRR